MIENGQADESRLLYFDVDAEHPWTRLHTEFPELIEATQTDVRVLVLYLSVPGGNTCGRLNSCLIGRTNDHR